MYSVWERHPDITVFTIYWRCLINRKKVKVMTKRSMGRKVIAILLAIAMVPTLVPGIAFAAEAPEPAQPTQPTIAAQSDEEPQAEEPAESEEAREEPTEETKAEQEEKAEPEKAPEAESPPEETPSGNDGPEDDPKSSDQEPAADNEDTSSDEAQDTVKEETGQETDAREEVTEEEEADEYPAQDFSGTAGGVSVKIHAPEGALPEGTEMDLSPVSQSSVIDAVQEAVGGDQKVTKIRAVDITFHDKDGNGIEPKKTVSVSLHTSGMTDGRSHKAFHITDGGSAEIVADASGGSAEFSARDFSPYGVEESVEAYRVDFYQYANDEEPYETIYCEDGEAIGTLPVDPGKDGATFTGWFVKDSDPAVEVTEETVVTGDMTVVAGYTDMVSVRFIMNNDEGEVLITKYDLVEGTPLGTLPQAPFKEGHKFLKWVDQNDPDTEVTADTLVPAEGMTVEAVFVPIEIYKVTAKYYYVVNGHRVDFDHDIFEIELSDVPFDITPPASTQVDEQYIPEEPTYYPSEPAIQVTSADIANAEYDEETGEYRITKEVEYVEYTAEYDFVYRLKNLSGQGYTEIERTHVYGVLNSTVTATVREYEYADFESTEPTVIDRTSGIEINVDYTRKNYTLSYDTNGGSYVPSVTAPYQTQVRLTDAAPTRTGYTFQGWYTDQALTQRAPAAVTLTKDTVLYAKWQGKTVGYTIMYMREKYDSATGASTWVFDRSRTGSGTVGETVQATGAPNITINGYEKDAEQNAASSITIAPDGSSVLKVYYKLIRYTLVFNHRSGTNYNNATLTIGGTTYTNTNYQVSGVVLGQDISDKWPTTVNSGRNGYTFTGWNYTNSSGGTTTRVTKVIELTWELVARANNGNATYNANYTNSGSDQAVEYWLQQPDGTYKKDENLSQEFYSSGTLGAKDLNGYSQYDGTPAGYSGSGNETYTEEVWVDPFDDTYRDNGGHTSPNPNASERTVTRNGHVYTFDYAESYSYWGRTRYYYHYVCHEDGHYETVTRTVYTYRFYYDRAQYTITYYDGGTRLRETDPIFFEADISGGTYDYTPAKPSGKEDYTWGGWYSDSNLDNKYSFGKMPGNDLVLYAKWIAPQYDVKYELQGGSATFETELTVDKGTQLSSPGSPVRDNYVFQGWYNGPDEDSTLFDWNQPITANTTIYAHWKQMPLSYTVHYYEAGTTDPLLPDRTLTNPAFEEGETITETAMAVVGYRPDAASKTVTLSFDDEQSGNVITFYYSKKAETTSYTVNYVLLDHPDIKVHESKTVEVEGSQVSARESAAKVNKEYMATQTSDEEILNETYYPVHDTEELILTAQESENVITFKYANYKTEKVTVNYLDMDGDPLMAPKVSREKVGATYQVKIPSIAGYIYHTIIDNNGESKTKYKIDGSGDLTINVYYQKKLKITANNKGKTYDGTALTSDPANPADIIIDGLESGHTVSGITFKGSQTDAGSSKTIPEGAEITGPQSDEYYAITYVPGTLTVSPANVTILIEPDRWTGNTYDGTERKAGFTNASKKLEDYVVINNANYKADHLNDFRDLLGMALITKTDAGNYSLTGDEVRSIVLETIGGLPEDSNYNVNLQVRECVLEISPAPLTVTTGSAEKGYDGTALTENEAGLTGLVGSETATVKATGAQIEVGSSDNTYTITWGTAKAGNYAITEDLGTLTVTKNSAAVTLTAPSDSKTYDGTPLTCDGTGDKKVTAQGLPEGFTVEATATGSATKVVDAGANVVDDGYVIWDADGNDKTENFTNVTKAAGKLTINPAPVTITTGSASKPYDGTVLTEGTAAITGLVNDETAEVTATGAQIEVGSSDNTYTIDWGDTDANNYTITPSLGTLTVTESSAEVVLTAPSATKTYDGTALTADGSDENNPVTATGLPEGFTVTASASGSRTDAGSTANVVDSGYVIRNAEGQDKTSSFRNVRTVDGTLTVNKAALTVTTGSGSKAYDGTPLTDPEASITGFVNNETATVTANGTITEVGTRTNTYSIEWGTAKEGNYTITENLGTLEVTKNNSEIRLTAASGEKTYDGLPLEDSTVTATGLPQGFTVDVSATGSQTDAGSSPNIVGSYVISNAAGKDMTASFTNVKKVNGTLKVNKAPLKITTGSAEKEFDGEPLTNTAPATADDPNGWKIEGLVNNEIALITVTGSQTEVGSGSNTYTITWSTAKEANYELTEALGTLTVTKSKLAIRLIAASDSKTYDGTALTNSTVEAKVGTTDLRVHGFHAVATAAGSQTDAGSSDNIVRDGYQILDRNNKDVTASFESIELVTGTLTVEPKAVTVKTGSAEKEYDGTPLTKAEASITGLVTGQTATVTATGSQTEVGSGSNGYTIAWGAGTNSNNYTITEDLGTLEVTENNAKVTLTAPSAEKVYDGTALTEDGTGEKKVTASGLPAGFTVEATASGSQTDAGESANAVKDGYVIRNAAGEDKTANFTNVKKADGTLKVTKAPVTISTGSASKAYDGTPLTKAEASITGLVNGETATVTATGSQTEVGSGSNTYSISWGTTNKDNYKITEELGTLTVTQTSAEVTLTAPSDSKTYDGKDLTCDGTGEKKVTASGLPAGFTVEATASGSAKNVGDEGKNAVDDGYIIRDADGNDKTANFTNITKVDGKLTINPAPVTISTGSGSKAYDGTPLTNSEVSIEGLVKGESVTLKATGSQTEVGSSDNTYSITWNKAAASNYTVTDNLGTLTVTSSSTQVTLTAASASKTYDGTALTNSGVTVSGLPAGFTFEAAASGSQTDAGESANVVNDGYRFFDRNGADKTANFTKVVKVDGKLTVNPKGVTISTGSGSKAYDGTPLTNSEVSIEGLVKNESVTLEATGTITEVGTADNTYSITWSNAKASNYTVTDNLGTLTITENSTEVILTAASNEKTYDGTALTNGAVRASGLPTGFTCEATASGSQTDAGESQNIVNTDFVIKDADGNDRTANFTNVTLMPGKLKVTRAPVTITTGSAGKEYDGTPLTKAEASIEGLVNHETAEVTATGSQTEVGESSNTYSIDWGKTNKDNYEITEKLGKLEVKANTAEVKLTAASDSKTYDGSPLTNSSVKASGLPTGFTVEASASGSRTDAGTDANVVNDGYVIRNAAGKDKTSSFTNVKKVNGTLTVNKAEVTVTTGSDSKAYDGTPLTKAEASIEGLVNGETATVTATGSRTEVGESDNTCSINWGATNENNYTVTEKLGKLKVTENSAAVTLTAASGEKVYDGTALTSNKVTASGLPEGFTVEASASGSATNVGDEGKNIVDDGYVIRDADGNDKTANFTNVTKADGKLTIDPATVTVRTGSASKAYDGTPLTKDEASITGLVNGETATVTATGTITEVGSVNNTYSIDWGTTNKDNYEITEDLGTLRIMKSTVVVTLTAASGSKTYDGTALTNSAVTASSLPAGFTLEATASGSATNVGDEGKNVVDDGYVIKNPAGEDKTANFTNITKVNGKLTINPAPVTISTGSASKAYDGTPLTKNEAKIEGLAEGESVTLKATGSQTEVGSSDNTYSITWDNAKASNYTVTEALGTLTVTSSSTQVTLTAASANKTYDGTALADSGVTVSGLPEGFTYQASASGSQTDAGEGTNQVNDGYRFFDQNGEDKTSNFTNVTKVDGKLTVSPKTVTITTGSDSKAYDGTPLTKNEITVEGMVSGESVTTEVTGSQTEVGESSNTYSITWDNAKAKNYAVTDNLGTLTITKNGAEVTLTAATASKTYDGSALTNSGVTASGLPAGFTAEATASGSQTDAGSSSNVVNDGYVIKDAAGNDKTANFTNVKKAAGTLTVNKAPVTITTGSASKEYDGTPLTKDEASIEGLVNGEKATVTATGSQTEIGSADNTYSIDWGKTNKDNYKITEKLGKLEVKANTAEVKLTAASNEKTYDGTALMNSGVKASGLPAGFTVEATASGSQTDFGESQNIVDTDYVIRDADGNVKTGNFTNITLVPGTLKVTKAPVTITTGSAGKAYDGTPLTKAEASIEGLVQGESVTLAATGSQTEVGESDNTYSITWSNAKAGNYTVTEKLGKLKVTENSAEVKLTAASDEKTYDGKALTNSGVKASGLPAGFTVEATASGSQTNAGESANVVNDGYVIRDAAGNVKTTSFTNVKKVDGTLKVTKAPVTITTGSASKAYDGTPLTNADVSIEGLVNKETATVTATGSRTEVGSSSNTYSIDWGTTNKDNYKITEKTGKLEVTTNSAAVTLTASSAGKPYDGTALTSRSVTASGLPTGFIIEATASGSATNVGDAGKNVVDDGYVIKNPAGEDKTANFTNITKVDGKLTINPAPVTISTGSASKAYDGKPLTKNEANIEGLAKGESVTLKATGSQTEVGSGSNTYSITWDNAKASNYTVTEALGTLTVTSSSTQVTLTAASASKTYDGTKLTDSSVTVSGLPEDFTYQASASGSQTDAGQGTNRVNDGYKFFDQNGEDKTSNFTNVAKVDGKLTVSPKAVTITTGSDSKAYDGTPLTKNELTIEGMVSGESITTKVTGSQTEVGSSSNTYSITWDNAKAKNYAVTDNLGTLTITKNGAEVKLTAATASKTYDGKALTDSGVKASGLPTGFTIEAEAEGSQTDAGESANKVKKGYKILDADGNEKTDSFTNVKTVDGTLTVGKASVTITTGSAGKEYDGKALTKDEASITGLVNHETAEVTATGSQTEVGSSDNTYSIKWGETNKDNYKITEKLGKLEVKANTAEVKLTAASAEKTYDGTALTDSGVKATGLPEGFTVEATASGSQTDFGESANVVDDGYVIKNAAGEDKTASFTNVTKVDGKLSVKKRQVTLTSADGEKEYDGDPLTKNAQTDITVSGDGFVSGEGATYTITGTQTLAGESKNTFTYTLKEGTKAGNYQITTVEGTLKVTDRKVPYPITVEANSGEGTYNGAPQTVSGLKQTSFEIEGHTYTVSGLTAKRTEKDAGEYAVDVTGTAVVRDAAGNDVTAQFRVTPKSGTLLIRVATLTIVTGSAQKAYDGSPLTSATASIEGLQGSDRATVTATGAQTEVGSSDNTYRINWGATNRNNYRIDDTVGKLTVTTNDAPIVVQVRNASKTYDGKPLTSSAVTAKGLPDEFTVEAFTDGSQTNAGSSSNTITEFRILDKNGENKTANFTNVATTGGTLTVEPKAISVTTGSAQKVYDGTALTNTEASIRGLIAGETAEITATGSQTEVGSSDNTYEITWDSAKENNYAIASEQLGILTVVRNDGTIIITSQNASRPYDGTALKAHKYTVTGLPKGFTAEVRVTGSATNVADTKKGNNTFTFVIRDASGKDVTDQFTDIVPVYGTLTITPRTVILTSGSAERTYNGKPLTRGTVTVSGAGFVNGEGAYYDVTGSQTDAGSSANEFTYTIHGKVKAQSAVPAKGMIISAQADSPAAANYKVTKKTGTLTVDKKKITVITPDATKTYDGAPLTANGRIKGLVKGETVTFRTTGSRTSVGDTVNSYSLKWDGTAKKSNYTIEEELGVLTVEAADTPAPGPAPGPTPGPAPGPAGGLGGPAGALGGGPATADLGDDPTPLTDLDDGDTPLADFGAWALINLIAMILTVIISLLLIIFHFVNRRRDEEDAESRTTAAAEDDDESVMKKKLLVRLAGLIPAFAAIIVFFLTEDMSLPMQMVDKWTIPMIIILVIEGIVALLAKKKTEEDDETDEQYA